MAATTDVLSYHKTSCYILTAEKSMFCVIRLCVMLPLQGRRYGLWPLQVSLIADNRRPDVTVTIGVGSLVTKLRDIKSCC